MSLNEQQKQAVEKFIEDHNEEESYDNFVVHLTAFATDILKAQDQGTELDYNEADDPLGKYLREECDKDAEIKRLAIRIEELEGEIQQFHEVIGDTGKPPRRLPDADLMQAPGLLAMILGKRESRIEELEGALEDIKEESLCFSCECETDKADGCE